MSQKIVEFSISYQLENSNESSTISYRNQKEFLAKNGVYIILLNIYQFDFKLLFSYSVNCKKWGRKDKK